MKLKFVVRRKTTTIKGENIYKKDFHEEMSVDDGSNKRENDLNFEKR